MKSFLKYWLPLLLWLGVIFFGSSDLMSAQHTSRFLVPFLYWLKPDISPETVAQVQFFMRKAAHLTEYAVLAILLWRAVYCGMNLKWSMSPDRAKPGSSFKPRDGMSHSVQAEGTGRPSRLKQSAALWVRSRSILSASLWITATLVAAADEFHQSFVESRTASPWDVMIDSGGAIFGLLISSGFARRRVKRES